MEIYTKKLILTLTGLIALILIFTLPFYKVFSVNFVDGHDFIIHLQKTYILEESIKKGLILPRYLPDATYGYGSPVFNFTWGVPYYLGAFLHLLGFSYQAVFKILIILPNILSGFGLFIWLKPKYGKFIAVVSAIVYIFTPYRFLDSFIRNALGELFFFAFLPFVLYFLDHAVSKNKIILGSFITALLIYSHQGLAVIGFAIFICYITIQYYLKKQNILLRNQVFILVGGLLLSFFYWLPAFVYSSLLSTRSSIRFLPLFSLIRSKWEGGSVFNGERLIMSYQIGLTQLSIIIFTHLYFFYAIIKKRGKDIYILYWLFLFWISIFFTQPISRWFWFNLPFIINLQFPFRFLFIPMFTTAVMAAFLLSRPKQNLRYLMGIILVIAAIITNRNHLGVQNKEIDLKELTTYKGTYDVGGVIFPKYFKISGITQEDMTRTTYQDFMIINGKGSITSQNRKDYISTAEIDMDTEGKLLIKRIYFPGWQIYRNEVKIDNLEKGNGIIILLPKGQSNIKVIYQDPLLITFSNYVSIVTLCLFLLVLLKSTFLQNIKSYTG